MLSNGGSPRRRSAPPAGGSTPPRDRLVTRVKISQSTTIAMITPTIVPTISPSPTPSSGAVWLFWARRVTANVVMSRPFPVRARAMRRFAPPRPGYGRAMETENRDDLPADDGAVEESGTGELGGSGVAGGAGEGVPGGPESSPYEPGEGPTADEETGITGDPDER
jgi:hypothetical protein